MARIHRRRYSTRATSLLLFEQRSTHGFTFADLFAGVGGCHATPHAAGGEFAYASEIDPAAAVVYDHTWLRPLREADPDNADRYQVLGNIVPLTDPVVSVPARADVLAAGFPRQPLSQSGYSEAWTRPAARCSGTSPGSSPILTSGHT